MSKVPKKRYMKFSLKSRYFTNESLRKPYKHTYLFKEKHLSDLHATIGWKKSQSHVTSKHKEALSINVFDFYEGFIAVDKSLRPRSKVPSSIPDPMNSFRFSDYIIWPLYLFYTIWLCFSVSLWVRGAVRRSAAVRARVRDVPGRAARPRRRALAPGARADRAPHAAHALRVEETPLI